MYKTVLVPIAIDHERDVSAALEVARKLVSDDGQIIALTVMEPMPAYVADEFPESIHQERVGHFTNRLREMLKEADDIEQHVKTGSAARTIHEFAASAGADLIVLASHRPEFSDIFLGSTAAWLVRHSKCAVHVLR